MSKLGESRQDCANLSALMRDSVVGEGLSRRDISSISPLRIICVE